MPSARAVNRPHSPLAAVNSGARFLFLVAVAIIVMITVVRMWIWWSTDAGISFASGVMITMATDLKDGVFYRPLLDSGGYGGTRYFPLYFCLHALLLKLGMPVLAGAYLLSAISILLLLVGTFQFLRALGAERWLAACSALAILASTSVQMSFSTPQADGLAAALNVCGLAAIARLPHNSRRTVLAALCFTLAWSAKLTTVFGLAAAFVWLIATGYKRVASLLAAETCGGYVLVAGTMILASHGRVVDIFRACATGGADWRFVVSGPSRMESMATYTDPVMVLFAVLGLSALVFLLFSSRFLENLPALFLVGTMLITMMIFGSPGTAGNHLLDVQVAAVILLAAWIANASPTQRTFGTYAVALLALLAVVPLLRQLRVWSRWYHPHQFERVIEVIGPVNAPILSENPVIPVLAGQRPYVLDPWMVQLLEKRIPGFAEPLLERLRNRRFSAVVLSTGDPTQKGGRWWYDNMSFGPGFVTALTEHYRLAQVLDNDWIYLPRTDAPQDSSGK